MDDHHTDADKLRMFRAIRERSGSIYGIAMLCIGFTVVKYLYDRAITDWHVGQFPALLASIFAMSVIGLWLRKFFRR